MGDVISGFGGRQCCRAGVAEEVEEFGWGFRWGWGNGGVEQPLPLGSLLGKEADVFVVGSQAKLKGQWAKWNFPIFGHFLMMLPAVFFGKAGMGLFPSVTGLSGWVVGLRFVPREDDGAKSFQSCEVAGVQKLVVWPRHRFEHSAAPLQHSLDGEFGFFAKFFVHQDFRGFVAEGVPDFFDGIELHVAAFVAGTVICGACDEGFFRKFPLEAVDHASFGHDDEGLGGVIFAEVYHFLRAANFVGHVANGLCAFGVGDYGGFRILESHSFYGLLGKENMGVTTSGPELHVPACLGGDPLPEILVGNKEDLPVLGDFFDNFDGVAAGADDVAECFYGR